MLRILIIAFLQARLGWRRAREISRLTTQLRTLTRAGHDGDYALRTHRRLVKLYEDA